MAKTDCGRIWVSEFRKYAKEKGWTDPYALVFPPVFSTVMLVSFFGVMDSMVRHETGQP